MSGYTVYLNIAQIIVSVALIVVVLLQAKGGGLSTIFGGEGSVYRTRRGLEKTLFQFTIVLAVVFGLISLLSVVVQRVAQGA
ncbi:MAG: preprotein translocase subunit SecG [Anaerolineae bacterium]